MLASNASQSIHQLGADFIYLALLALLSFNTRSFEASARRSVWTSSFSFYIFMPSSSLPAFYDKLQLQHPRPLVDATAFLKLVVREARKRSVSPQEFLRQRWFLSGPEVYFSRAYLQKHH